MAAEEFDLLFGITDNEDDNGSGDATGEGFTQEIL